MLAAELCRSALSQPLKYLKSCGSMHPNIIEWGKVINMQKLKVISESLPIRCEICHKSDYFDKERNICSRCKDILNNYYKVERLILLILKSLNYLDRICVN